MIEIPLTQGKVAVIDDESWDRVKHFKWHAIKRDYTYYACTTVKNNGYESTLRMHDLIMFPFDKPFEIDHKDGDGLNNQLYNLRPCTRSQNRMNSRRERTSSMRFKGVTKSGNKYRSQITVDGIKIYMGTYETDIEAAVVYNKAAASHFGEFANLNIIPKPNEQK